MSASRLVARPGRHGILAAVLDPAFVEARRPVRDIDLRAATLFVLYGDDDRDPPGDDAFAAWCDLVRRERVWRPEAVRP